jgi:hypothetical protein
VMFLMLICRDRVPVESPPGPAGSEVGQWVAAMDTGGIRVAGGELAPETEARAVRIRDSQLQVAEGAVLDTGGTLLGFDVLECQDMAEAVEVASSHPLARRHVLEIRPAPS